MATIVRISSEQLISTDLMSDLERGGSMGKSAIWRPRRVRRPSSSKAPRQYSSSSAVSIVFVGGGSMKSKCRRSLIPMALSIRIVFDKF